MSILLALTLLACGASPTQGTTPAERTPTPPSRPEVTAEQPTIVLMVLDTVRADRTSLCGHDRPTTPMLDDMEKRGASFTCRAYSPAPWTLPSHASFFTGQPVVEHGVEFAPESALAVNPNLSIRPLPDDVTTLAEALAERGYQTVSVAANPVLDPASGLLQGFEDTRTANAGSQGWRGPKLGRQVTKALEAADPDRPLFLFVNIYDAHDPYPAIPADAGWVPQRPSLRMNPVKAENTNPFFQFHRGELTGEALERWLDHARDTYDWGVRQADRNVGRVLQELKQQGWGEPGVRMVITSDHGELFGEHGHMRHGGYLYEGVVNVPFVYLDTTREEPLPLPEPLDGRYAHHLLLEGSLPDALEPPSAVSTANPHFFDPGRRAVAVWAGHDKLERGDEGATVVDLSTDPTEDAPEALGDAGHPSAAALASRWDALVEMEQRPVPQDLDVTNALQALGYMHGDDEDDTPDDDPAFDLLGDGRDDEALELDGN